MSASDQASGVWRHEDLQALEALVDRYSLASAMEALGCIAHEKAEHIASNWQDLPLSKEWDRAATKIDKFARKVTI